MTTAQEITSAEKGGGRLARKVVLVTGAGRGQGRNHAIRMAEEGADIIAVDICGPVAGIEYPMASEEDLALTEKMVRDRGRSIITSKVDVRDLNALTSAVQEGVTAFGRLDVVVANAGVITASRFEEHSIQEWEANLGVNVVGVRNTLLAAMPHLVAAGGGSVVTISSVSGLVGGSLLSAYIASKHAVVGLTRALAIEWGVHRIRVNTVSPGAVANTGIATHLQPLFQGLSEKERSAFATALPNPLIMRDDTSAAVIYLASDDARNVTGTVMEVDAGLVAI
ncbi:3-ketoacyl-ACP reductase [Virgisporangium aliadipatigenens]|uniref:3-ketoacyl-ACP reductase n=1 Tax=Virgisporangium aliadipatigenens TaxID=741659 RepID=A0A8J4DPR4_9ACTN|nr:mycofactocin-coupled SDR family oxidoreductase [Virgisporangium aliadipatigenens]GIJ46240.1 3-ketoacyl-ACP reductase [Virgisporangium aliadipatigenens]